MIQKKMPRTRRALKRMIVAEEKETDYLDRLEYLIEQQQKIVDEYGKKEGSQFFVEMKELKRLMSLYEEEAEKREGQVKASAEQRF